MQGKVLAVPDSPPLSAPATHALQTGAGSAVPWLQRLARAAVSAPSAEVLCTELTLVLDAAMPFDQVHLFEVAQGAAGGEARVMAGAPGDGYVQTLDERPSGVVRVTASGAAVLRRRRPRVGRHPP